MHIIKKVLNSSIVLTEGEQGQEFIVMSKGVGYGKRPGETVELTGDSRFFMPVDDVDGRHLLELLDSIPPVYLEMTRMIVEYAKAQDFALNEHIFLALTDHLAFAVKRYREHLSLANKMFWEMKTFYPKEYQVGCYALSVVEEKTGITLPQEEAANITFHIINASKDAGLRFDAMRSTRIISETVTTVTYLMKVQLNPDSFHYSRFITHLQFFAERFLTDRMLESPDDFLYTHVEKEYPEAMACGERIRTLLLKEYGNMATNEEIAYLAIHIQRVSVRE